MAEAIRDGLRLEAIAADIAGDGDTALEMLSVNAYDLAVLDRDIPGPSGDEVAESIERWRAQGERVVLATVVATRRSAPRPVGARLAVSQRGELAGSVSGGCVEPDRRTGRAGPGRRDTCGDGAFDPR